MALTEQVMVNNIQQVMHESINYLTDRMALNALATKGNVTLQEADLYNKMAAKVITEMADEMVPDSVPAVPEPMKLTGEDGTIYSFDPASCSLTPIEGNSAMMDNVQESTANSKKSLTESEQIVNDLIKTLN